MTSHAWVEMNGKKIDMSLAFTEHPDIQLPGEVLILDQVYKTGHRYDYYRARTDDALAAVQALADDPRYENVVRSKEAEHTHFVETAKGMDSIRHYLDAALDRLTYEVLSKFVCAPELGT